MISQSLLLKVGCVWSFLAPGTPERWQVFPVRCQCRFGIFGSEDSWDLCLGYGVVLLRSRKLQNDDPCELQPAPVRRFWGWSLSLGAWPHVLLCFYLKHGVSSCTPLPQLWLLISQLQGWERGAETRGIIYAVKAGGEGGSSLRGLDPCLQSGLDRFLSCLWAFAAVFGKNHLCVTCRRRQLGRGSSRCRAPAAMDAEFLRALMWACLQLVKLDCLTICSNAVTGDKRQKGEPAAEIWQEARYSNQASLLHFFQDSRHFLYNFLNYHNED